MKGFMTAAGIAIALLGAQPAAAHHDEEGPVNKVDAATAFNNDVAILARNRGWTLEATRNRMRFQDAFSNLVPKIAAKYANTYAGASMAPAPGDPAVIRFKGAVPPSAAADIAASGLTIDVKGGAKYTQKEIRERSTAIARYLMSLGYRDASTAVMPAGFVEVTIGSSSAPKPVLPPSLREDARITVIEGPANREEHTRGGAWLQVNGVNDCTSGFTVTSFGGTDGVSTAAHCTNWLDEYNPPNGDDDYDIDFQDEHLGLFGDMQWHTSDHVEPAEYYATSTEIRDQDSVEPFLGITNNSDYCIYGRSSNNRECDEVYSDFVNAISGLTLISSLVGMTEDNTIGGDSGGPWSFGNEATGGHRGDQWIWFKYRNVFSVADLFPAALGVFVQT